MPSSRKFLVLIALIPLAFAPACGALGQLEDLTAQATVLLESITELTQLVDQKIASGDLDEEAGAFLDERLENLSKEIIEILDEGGGKVFDRLDGSIDNAFANIQETLEQIRSAVLDRNEGLVRQLTDSVQETTLILAGQAEGILLLAFGNIQVAIDKVANSILTVVLAVLLVIGLLIFVFAFRKRKLRNRISLAFAGVYTVTLLTALFVPQARAVLVYGVSAGSRVDPNADLSPVVTAAAPQVFILGETRRLTLYGRRLDRLADDAVVGLFRGGELAFAFPREAIAAITPTRIVLGNFDDVLGWGSARLRGLLRRRRARPRRSDDLRAVRLLREVCRGRAVPGPAGASGPSQGRDRAAPGAAAPQGACGTRPGGRRSHRRPHRGAPPRTGRGGGEQHPDGACVREPRPRARRRPAAPGPA